MYTCNEMAGPPFSGGTGQNSSPGDAHGYMGRLREEFEQQTSKLSRREITKARAELLQSSMARISCQFSIV